MSAVLPLFPLPPVADGSVVHLQQKPVKGTVQLVEALCAEGGKGFVGDYSFGKRRRQASFCAIQELGELGYAPGVLRENVTVDLPGLQELPKGTRLILGEVEFEIESDMAPCGGMARRLGEPVGDFVRKSTRRRGMLLKVVTSGTIRVGDPVYILRGE
jgi:MOSC domain-containing protein YiiM